MVFQYRNGYRGSVPATVAGERIALLEEANGGHVTPGDVVDDARPDEAPLHPCFEWDDPTAAERYREDQARSLIRSVYRVETDEAGESRPMLHHVHVRLADVGNCYVTTARAMGEDELREQVEADAMKAFEALRERYRHIRSLAPIFAAIDATKARVKRKKPAREVAATV